MSSDLVVTFDSESNLVRIPSLTKLLDKMHADVYWLSGEQVIDRIRKALNTATERAGLKEVHSGI